jgi:cytochrome P450
MTDLTMSIIGKVLFDADIFSETDKLGAAMTALMTYVTDISSALLPLPYSWPLPRNRRTRKAVQVLHSCFCSFIAERRAHPTERNDFLTILLQAKDDEGSPMSDEQLMAECLILFLGGHETTSTALTWTWYLLCEHPEIYQEVEQEVDGVLQGRTPTYADVARLPYCLQVFKEAIRLYPPAHVFPRQALHDVEIDSYLVPKGGMVLISPYTLHRRSDNFPQSETFDPERFTPEREKLLPRHAYLPFGAGPRSCIGMYFALMEGQLLLAILAQRHHFTLVPGQIIEPDSVHYGTLKPATPVYITIKKR